MAEKQGRLLAQRLDLGARRELRLAVSLAPERADLRAEHARVDACLLASLAHTYEEQALYEQRQITGREAYKKAIAKSRFEAVKEQG